VVPAVGIAAMEANLHPAVSETQDVFVVDALRTPVRRLFRVGTEDDVRKALDVLPECRKGVIWRS
jgi:hypothetical protein